MADFSFSFDSDNPFADPQTPPKKASDATEPTPEATEPTPAPEAAPGVPNAGDDDAFPLDALDFAFDGDDSNNDNLPSQGASGDSAPRELTPGEAAFAEFDFDVPASTNSQAPEPEVAESSDAVKEVEAPTTEAIDFAVPDFDASVAPPAEISQGEVAASEVATTDLEEFNALALDLDAPAKPDAPASDDISEAPPEAPPEIALEADDLFVDAAPDAIESNETATEKTDADEKIAEEEIAVAASDLDDEIAPPLDAPSSEELFGESGLPDAIAAVPEAAVPEAAVPEAAVPEAAVPEAAGSSVVIADDENEDEATETRPRKPRIMPLVAILGASGIGKNHARWFHRNGCRVIGFLGSSDDSTAQTESDLSAEFEFEGQAYTDLSELLQHEKPDIVCVATPPPLHFGQVLQSLESGAHVLCEKPLVYAPTRKFRENRDGAKELVKVAAKKKLILGTQLQYGAATPILCKLAGLAPSEVGDFAMELETTNPNSPRDAGELWIDMGPHPISVAQMLAGPDATIAEETISFEPYEDESKTEVLARFGINCADGRLLMVRAVVRNLRGENLRKPRRRFSFNGHSVTYAPLQSKNGGFQAQFVAPDGYASVYADPVDYLIGDFVRACRDNRTPLITGDFGRENLEWMLKVAMPANAR